jgi:hypothetical protein
MKLAVVMPVGPGLDVDFTSDTLDSVRHWCSPDTAVVVVDDSGAEAAGARLLERHADLLVVRPPKSPSGVRGGLLLADGAGFRRALALRPQVVLRLDSDAVVTGPAPEDDALAYFEAHPRVGLLGSYRISCTGVRRDFSWTARQLAAEALPAGWRDPRRALTLTRLLRRARRHGYEPGEHALGAATFLRPSCLLAMDRRGWLTAESLRSSQLADDHLLGLLVRAAGFELADFAPDPHPVGVAWRGLPMAPEELLEHGKKVVHSVKNHPGTPEAELRAFFAARRDAAPSHS